MEEILLLNQNTELEVNSCLQLQLCKMSLESIQLSTIFKLCLKTWTMKSEQINWTLSGDLNSNYNNKLSTSTICTSLKKITTLSTLQKIFIQITTQSKMKMITKQLEKMRIQWGISWSLEDYQLMNSNLRNRITKYWLLMIKSSTCRLLKSSLNTSWR